MVQGGKSSGPCVLHSGLIDTEGPSGKRKSRNSNIGLLCGSMETHWKKEFRVIVCEGGGENREGRERPALRTHINILW